MPTKTTDRRPLISYLRVQKANDRLVLDTLRRAAQSIDHEIARLESAEKIGGRVRRDQLLQAKAAMHRQMEQMWSDIGDTVRAGKEAAAAAAVDSMIPEKWLRAAMPDADVDYLMRSAKTQAARGIDTVEARLNLSKVPLSESVYANAAVSNGVIDDIVNAGLASGASAAEIAKSVLAYVNPATPGGAKYAAMRLGRTELNNAFHATQIKEAIDTPWTTSVKWNLSGSHPRPDECNAYADDVHMDGGEAGVWAPNQIPPKPHPNCLCFTTPVTDDREEFLRKLQAGSYDDYLDKEFGLDPASRFVSPPPAPKPVSKPTPPEVKSAPKPTPGVAPSSDVPQAFSDLKTMEPQGYREAVKLSNNMTSSAAEYNNNCHYVVNAMEMRARGFDVTAAPTFRSTGRYTRSVERDWVDPATGDLRKFTFAVPRAGEDFLKAVSRVAEDWPPNSRGIIQTEWKSGGGHFWSVYKDSKGVLKFPDGQSGRVQTSDYFGRARRVRVLRVDDLEPVADRVRMTVENDIEKVTKASQERRLRNLIKQTEEDIGGSGAEFNGYSHELQELLAAAHKLGITI